MKPARARRWLLVVATAFLALAATGAVYERVSVTRLFAHHPAPGELVPVGNQLLHLHCSGTGTPVVVIEAGVGSFSLDWQGVRRSLAGTQRVCAYDRPGLGWSPAAANEEEVNEVQRLRDLLRAAGEPGPYLLVGHSLGGLNIQRFARSYPEQVAGIVLVDSVHPQQAAYLPSEVQALQSQSYDALAAYAKLAHLGVPRLATSLGAVDLPSMPALTDSEQRFRTAISVSARYLSSVVREARDAERDLRHRQADDQELPSVPLIVISRGRPEPTPGLTEEVLAANERAWQELQADLSELTAHGQRWIAESSGHNIMLERPDLIAKAIEETANYPLQVQNERNPHEY